VVNSLFASVTSMTPSKSESDTNANWFMTDARVAEPIAELSIAALLLLVAVNSTFTLDERVEVFRVAPANVQTKPSVALPAVMLVTRYVAELAVLDSLARVMSASPAELQVAVLGVEANSPLVSDKVTRPLAEY